MILSIVGLGSAGSAIASTLVSQGVTVNGFDLRKVSIPGVNLFTDVGSSVVDSDFVLSTTSSTVATKVLKDVIPHMKKDAIFVDLNTTSPGLKIQLSKMVESVDFIDGAIMQPLYGESSQLPIIVSGPAAAKFAREMDLQGMSIEVVGESIGDAARRESIKNLFTKGITSVVIDALWAAQALGLENWAIEEFRKEFDRSSTHTLQYYLDATASHAKREQVAMSDIISMLDDAHYESLMTAPTELVLSHIIHSKKVPFAQSAD